MKDSEKTEIRKLQEIDLNIAKEFARICDDHNLKYFMLGGTMLGVVRHKHYVNKGFWKKRLHPKIYENIFL